MSKCVLKIKNIIPSTVLYFLRFQICIKKKPITGILAGTLTTASHTAGHTEAPGKY